MQRRMNSKISLKWKNKWAIIGGIILAALDFGFFGSLFIYYCATNNPSCGEGWVVMYLHMPTLYLFVPFLQGELSNAIFTAIAGIIQYFIVGYVIGYLIYFTVKIAENFINKLRKHS